MRKIAHLVNPFTPPPASDVYFAQPVTFETMRIAQAFAAGKVEVELLTAQYPEDRAVVPEWFRMTRDLDRSILDFGDWKSRKKRPLLQDILDRLYEATQAEYLVYTNTDISVMPHFYVAINAFIESGYDGFAINRRSISDKYRTLAEIPLMYAEVGKKHEGHDCFVFRREVYPKFRLGNISTAIPLIGRVFLWNVFAHAQRFKEFKRRHLTFHLGDSVSDWRHGGHADLLEHNRREALKILDELEKENADFDRAHLFALYPLDFHLGEINNKPT